MSESNTRLESLAIENFQSHERSALVLHPGINAMVGDSDCGKSAIMRALLWCVTNSPQGDAYVSNWNKDAKGKAKKPTSVTIGTATGPVTRKRDKDFNGYVLGDGDRVFEALRTDVPAEVAAKFNLGPVNIQRQMDPPFMVSLTPGEAARYINGLVDLSIIDEALSAVNSKARDTSGELKYAKAQVETRKAELDALDWVDELEALAELARCAETRLQEARKRAATLSESLEAWETARKRSESLGTALEDIGGTLDRLERVSRDLDKSIRENNRVASSFRDYVAAKEKARGMDKVEQAGELLSRADGIRHRIEKARAVLDGNGLRQYDAARPTAVLDLEAIEKTIREAVGLQDRLTEARKVLREGEALGGFETAYRAARLDLGPAEATLSRLSRMESALHGCREELDRNRAALCNYGTALGAIERADAGIKEAYAGLDGQVCPVCGRPLHLCET